MIVPYKSPRRRPQVAWLISHEAALHEDGGLYRLDQLEGVQVWAGFELVNDLLRDCHGEAVCWDGKPIRWSAVPGSGAFNVRVLHLSYPENPEPAIAGLASWRDWLCAAGAAPAGSLGGSGISLVKATLEAPLWTGVGELPPVRFVLGGRQELGPNGAPAVFDGPLVHLDMRAAYAQTLGGLRYGGRWMKVGAAGYPLSLDQNGKLLFVRAQVEIPELDLGPLPERPRSERNLFVALLNPVVYPAGRTLQGTWTLEELEQAERAGCRIKRVLDIWVHTPGIYEYPFGPWWEAVQRGRELPGFGGALAKATGNATWGMFAVRRHGRRQILARRREGKRTVREWSQPLPTRGNPSLRAPDLAESITGRVRAELHRGMSLAGDLLVCAHTDGLWAFKGVSVPGWRRKLSATGLRLLNPQAFAWTSKEGVVEYVLAGVPAWRAEDHFERAWEDQEQERAGRPYALSGAVPADPIPLVVRGRLRHLKAVS